MLLVVSEVAPGATVERGVCLQAFEDEQHGFLVGIQMAEALVRHHGLGWSRWA
jgi:hypothetical protein